MKDKIHPKYQRVTASCACGASFEVGSTRENIRVDICSQCHPLFTGTEKLIDTAGRVDRFKKMTEKAQAMKKNLKSKSKAEKKAKKTEKTKK